ncbi:Hypothetical predicted protein [Mytilus galloprovincialis]|uniref:Uncharacterized protein n=1 Tax=Mytilus galloprovincialis TaxID=29158 RepID=A0A8B6DX83_MYTGA|nr:Hypothetical predicted protein [Mytilus galloprovincialis]
MGSEREQHQHADKLSRHTDHDDWAIHSDIFDEINSLWGPYTIDRFATHYNTQCERFNSKIWYPGTEAVDAFSQNWNTETNWLVPPPSLISMVVRKVENDKANSTLVIPEWKSAPFGRCYLHLTISPNLLKVQSFYQKSTQSLKVVVKMAYLVNVF